MPNLPKAYALSLNMRRNPSGLHCDKYDRISVGKDGEFGGQCVVFKGDVNGGSEAQTVTVTFPNIPPQPSFKPVTLKRMNDARWHCTCPDFRFTFHWHLDEIGASLYPVPPYDPVGTRPPRSIQEPGMCKHVMAFVNSLVASRAISPFLTGAD